MIFRANLSTLNIGLMMYEMSKMAGGGGNKKRFQYCADPSGQEILYLRALQGHSGRSRTRTGRPVVAEQSDPLFAGLREMYRMAISAKTGRWLSGSSSSSGGDEKKSRDQDAERKVEQLRTQQRVETEHEGQGDST